MWWFRLFEGMINHCSMHGADPICSICLNQLDRYATVTLPCNHTFCRYCVEQWALHNINHESVKCPLCKAPFTDGTVLTSSHVSYGISLPAVRWRLPVSINSASYSGSSTSAPTSANSQTLSLRPSTNTTSSARIASTHPLDHPVWQVLPNGRQYSLAESRRHLMYYVWTSDRFHTAPMSSISLIPKRAHAKTLAWIKRDLRAVYHAILMASPQLPNAFAEDTHLPTYDPLLELMATQLILASDPGPLSDHVIEELAHLLQVGKDVAQKIVIEAIAFAASGWTMLVFDAMTHYPGVPSLLDMALHDSVPTDLA